MTRTDLDLLRLQRQRELLHRLVAARADRAEWEQHRLAVARGADERAAAGVPDVGV